MNEKRAIMRWMAAAILAVSATLTGCGGGNAGCTNFGGTGCTESSNGSSGGSSGSGSSQMEPASLVFDSALPADQSIVIKGAGGAGRTETAVLKFLVKGVDGNPVRGQQVTFSVVSTKAVTLNITKAVSDADGMVMASVNSGVEPTTFRVKAELANKMSTMSDTVTVGTGEPSGRAISLSPVTGNIEGWQYDDERTPVKVMIADQFGNPVADGTAVTFQTDKGAIGTSSRGGCITVDGGCSVEFRSQNPRSGPGDANKEGVATITASLTSGDATFTQSTFVTMSGSRPGLRPNDAGLPESRSMNDCAPELSVLTLADVNGNPMPEGTSLSATNSSGLELKIFGDKVDNLSGVNGGTTHGILITPPEASCVPVPAGVDVTSALWLAANRPVTGLFGLTITTPKRVETTYVIQRAYWVARSQ